MAIVVGTLAGVWLLGGWEGAAAPWQTLDAQGRAAALQAFSEGVERYAALRARYEAPLPSFDTRRDPWSVHLSRLFLASAIRTARHNASLGDVVTPAAALLFRTLIAEAVYELDVEGLVDEDLDLHRYIVDLVVNEPVPAWALQRVPDALLTRLPPLPPAVEYRLVGDALVLWDAHAEILIDAVPYALTAP
jgi:hypothetical protein